MYSEEISEGQRRLSSASSTRGSFIVNLKSFSDGPTPRKKTKTDQWQRVFITAVAITAFFALGSVVGVTGPAIPFLAAKLGYRETKLGSLFTCRGSGYLMGSFLASVLDKHYPKHCILIFQLLLAGLATLIAAYVNSFSGLLTVIGIQGVGLGGVDVSGNAVLVELWGTQVDPIMQALHASFGIGAVVSPAVVGLSGYVVAFVAFAIVCIVPFLAFLIDLLIIALASRKSTAAAASSSSSSAAAAAAAETGGKGGTAVITSPAPAPVIAPSALSSLTAPLIITTKENREDDLAEPSSSPSPSSSFNPTLTIDIHDGIDGRGAKIDTITSVRRGSTTSLGSHVSTHDKDLAPIPPLIRFLIAFFLFVYVGVEVGYGGWIASVLLLNDLTDSEDKAAFGVSVFWAAITAGRLLAIPLAVLIRPTRFLIFQMLLMTTGSVLLLTISSQDFYLATIGSSIYGLGMSSISPLMMTLPGDLGLLLDMTSTTIFLIGSCIGEALIPLLIGLLMGRLGVDTFGYCVFGAAILMWMALGVIQLTVPNKEKSKEGQQEQ